MSDPSELSKILDRAEGIFGEMANRWEKHVTSDARERALRILKDHDNSSHTAVHNALIDLRRNAECGDERVLRPFLDHYDPMVVAATLYTLFEVHNQRSALRPLVERLATDGDEREGDDLDRPIQCMAIELLASIGRHDGGAINMILEIAENHTTADTPRMRAWERLADLFGAEWPAGATEEMILRPESEASEWIRNCIRKAIASDKTD